MRKKARRIAKRLSKECLDCGRKIKVIVYADKGYRGGHYFGKVPVYSKRELKKMEKGDTHVSKVGDFEMNVYNYDPKPRDYFEYWECPRCYWRY